MPDVPPRLTVPVLLLAVLAVVACGESSEDRYSDELPSISRQLVVLGEDVGEGLRDAGESGDRALAREFGSYARRAGDLRERLDELEPPDGFEQEHARLLAAVEPVRAALADVAAAAERSDTAAARAAAERLVRGGERVEQARRALDRAARRR